MSKKRAHSAVEPAQQPQQTQQQAPTEYSLPKRLAHNDKAIRDGAIAALVKWLDRAEDISELDMMKLWKGLFYCFWMSDKEAVQEELAGNMANILQQVQPERGMLYLDCFFKTLRREWEGLDRLRMDKFMRLVRKFVFSAFRLLQRSDWDPLLGVWITSIIGTDLFEAKNRGLLMHMSDVVLQELVRVHSDEPVVTPLPTTTPAGGKKKKKNKKNNQPEPEPEPEKEEDDEDGAGVIDALSLQRLLAPFYLLLGESKDVALSKRVSEGVFEALIAVVKQDAKEGEEDHVLRPTVLQLLPTMSDKLFQLASAPNILDSVRNRLYPLRMACKEQITRHQLDEKDIFDDHFEEEGEDEGDEGDFEGDEFDDFDFEGDEGDDQFDFGDFEGDEGEEEGEEEEEEEAPQLVPVATEKTVPLPRRSSPIVLPQATGKAAKASKAATTTAKPTTTKTIQPTTQAVEQPTPQKTTKKKAPTAPTTLQPPPTPPTPQQTTTTKKSIATPPPPPPPPTPTTTTGKAAKNATTSPKATTNNNNNNNNKAQTPATTKKAKAVAPTQATPPPPTTTTTTKTAVTGKRKNETAPSPSPAKTQQTPAKGRAKKQ